MRERLGAGSSVQPSAGIVVVIKKSGTLDWTPLIIQNVQSILAAQVEGHIEPASLTGRLKEWRALPRQQQRTMRDDHHRAACDTFDAIASALIAVHRSAQAE